MNNKKIFLIALTFFAAIAACVIPGLQPASVPTPAPTTDTSGILSTMVAETVSAAIALTEQSVPTPTIVPDTPAPTNSPTAEIAQSAGTLTLQGDGSTLFVDDRAGYEVTVPAGWLAVGVNKQEFSNAFTLTPEIQNFLLSIESKDPNIFRLFAIDTNSEHFQESFFTNINFTWDEQHTDLLKNDDGLKAGITQLAGLAPEPEILSTSLSTTVSGISAVFIEAKYTVKDSSNKDIVILQKQFIFNTRVGTTAVTISTVEGVKDAVFSTFDTMLETIKISAQ